jgi:hypothetical protein
MTHAKALYLLGFLVFVGHIVILLGYVMEKIYVVLYSYTVCCGPRRLQLDLTSLKNDPQNPFFAVTR